jgi:hypothetical protein
LFSTGHFSGTATFDTGGGAVTLASSGGQDIFVARRAAPAPPPGPLGFSSQPPAPQASILSSPTTVPVAAGLSAPRASAVDAVFSTQSPANTTPGNKKTDPEVDVLDDGLLSLIAVR